MNGDPRLQDLSLDFTPPVPPKCCIVTAILPGLTKQIGTILLEDFFSFIYNLKKYICFNLFSKYYIL